MTNRQTFGRRFFLAVAFGYACVLAWPLHAADPLPSFELTAKDGRFIPETVEVPAGQKFKLVVRNEGPGPEEFESHELNREKIIPAGQKVDITIGPLKAGRYKFFGEFHPETANGQIVAK